MSATLVGKLRDRLGHARVEDFDPDRMLVRTRAYGIGSETFAPTQYATVPVNVEHGPEPVGAVDHLELRETDSSLWVVATLFDLDVTEPRETFLSAELEPGDDGVMLAGIALTRSPALVGAWPARILPGVMREARGCGWQTMEERALLDRALAATRQRTRSKPVLIHRHRTHATRADDATPGGRPPGRMHYSQPYPGILSVR